MLGKAVLGGGGGGKALSSLFTSSLASVGGRHRLWGKALGTHGDSGPRWQLPPEQEVTGTGFQRPGSWSSALLSWVDLGQVPTSQGLSFLICKMGVEERSFLHERFPLPVL